MVARLSFLEGHRYNHKLITYDMYIYIFHIYVYIYIDLVVVSNISFCFHPYLEDNPI